MWWIISTILLLVKDQGEVLLDSEIMTISSHVLRKCTLSLSKDINCYDPIEFADKIVSALFYIQPILKVILLQYAINVHL